MTDKHYVHFEYLAETCEVAEFDHEGTRTEITTEVSCPSCVEELTRWVAEDTQYGGRCPCSKARPIDGVDRLLRDAGIQVD